MRLYLLRSGYPRCFGPGLLESPLRYRFVISGEENLWDGEAAKIFWTRILGRFDERAVRKLR